MFHGLLLCKNHSRFQNNYCVSSPTFKPWYNIIRCISSVIKMKTGKILACVFVVIWKPLWTYIIACESLIKNICKKRCQVNSERLN